VIWKAATTDLAHAVNQLQRPSVLSGRLKRTGPAWLLRPLGETFAERRRLVSLSAPKYKLALISDMESFYESIQLARLWAATSKIGPSGEAARRLAPLAHWQKEGLTGLPIGPDTSEVYGSYILNPLDIALEHNGYDSIRLMDDLVVWLHDGDEPRARLTIDTAVAPWDITRSEAKTILLPADQVEEYLTNAAIEYHTGGAGGIDRPTATRMFHDAIEEGENVDFNALAYSISWFADQCDAYPVAVLTSRPELLGHIPKQLYRLVRGLAKEKRRDAHRFFSLVAGANQTESTATTYLVQVGLARATWGVAEGMAVVQHLASSVPTLRAAALRLQSRTPILGLDEVVVRALVGEDIESRGAAVALHGLRDTMGINTAALHIRCLRPARTLETLWATGAA